MMTASRLVLPSRSVTEKATESRLFPPILRKQSTLLYSLVLTCIWKLDPKFPENVPAKGIQRPLSCWHLHLWFFFYIRKVPRMERDVLLFAILVVFNPALFSSCL